MSNPISRIFFRFLAGEKAIMPEHLRFARDVATRSPPKPHLPEGPAHKVSNNAYYMRDNRRAARPVVRDRLSTSAQPSRHPVALMIALQSVDPHRQHNTHTFACCA
ncbi:uncharacterized protein MONBRDRAFT_8878 [Monosiga brevicollis MX1]|uniref:NADH dehydrogenase [ubiquinone] 1 alpha subcomplex subunit 7 n=1 Tax=Monosiga brevicollis TaxID=81824 RepID=A9V1E1_MONBE|nr:uncharacterized protein MONBRDRAFT_8878 [Monosiga brevicollis MX1]EDQ88424.1 predicted protein [Monosiga brevicollis MX1]|eukprot:XP_001746528.1 hypothetical protein [Monosiga brevicollis MX1]